MKLYSSERLAELSEEDLVIEHAITHLGYSLLRSGKEFGNWTLRELIEHHRRIKEEYSRRGLDHSERDALDITPVKSWIKRKLGFAKQLLDGIDKNTDVGKLRDSDLFSHYMKLHQRYEDVKSRLVKGWREEDVVNLNVLITCEMKQRGFNPPEPEDDLDKDSKPFLKRFAVIHPSGEKIGERIRLEEVLKGFEESLILKDECIVLYGPALLRERVPKLNILVQVPQDMPAVFKHIVGWRLMRAIPELGKREMFDFEFIDKEEEMPGHYLPLYSLELERINKDNTVFEMKASEEVILETEDGISLDEFLKAANSFRLRQPYILIVGGLAIHGRTEGDIDILVKESADAPVEYKKRLEETLLSGLDERLKWRVQFHYDKFFGPFTNNLPIYNLTFRRINPKGVVENSSRIRKQVREGMLTYEEAEQEAVLAKKEKTPEGEIVIKSEISDFEKGIRQLFGSPGGKSRAAKLISSFIPDHRIYVEPFAGGAAVFFSKVPSEIDVLNDKDGELIRTYHFLKEADDVQIDKLANKNWIRDRKLFENLRDSNPKEEIDKVYRFLYTRIASYGSDIATGFSQGHEGKEIKVKDHLKKVRERLSGVRLASKDFREIIEKYDSKETFFFFDPPYPSHWGRWHTPREHHELDIFPEELAGILKKVKGKFILSYETESEKYFKGFEVKKIQMPASLDWKDKRKKRYELLISNFPLEPSEKWIAKGERIFEKGVKQPFGSPGGKKILAARICSYIPQHTVYCEPFIGGGAVFFRKNPSEVEVINDKDPEIAFAYRFIKGLTKEDLGWLKKRGWKITREHFERVKRMQPKDDKERFYKFYYLAKASYGRRGDTVNTGSIDAVLGPIDYLERVKERLRGVLTYCKDYKDLLKAHDSNETFFYLDPPYPGKGNFEDLQINASELKETCRKLAGKFILSLPTSLSKEFSIFHQIRVKTSEQFDVGGTWQKTRFELLISNFPLKPEFKYIEKEEYFDEEESALEKGVRPAFGSPGGKRFLARKICSYISKHETYVEPFVGGGAVFFAKEPSETEVINDRDPEIAFAYKFIQGIDEDQISQLRKFKWIGDKQYFNQLKDRQVVSDVERFHKFLYLRRCSRQDGKSFRYLFTGQDMSSVIERLPTIKERLKNIKVSGGDFLDILEKYDSGKTFFYLDPPYPSSDYPFTYKVEISRIKNAVENLRGRFILSYENSDEAKEAFKTFEIKTVRVKRWSDVPGGFKVDTELLVSNFPLQPIYEYIEKGLVEESTLDLEADFLLLKPEFKYIEKEEYFDEEESALEKGVRPAFGSPGGKTVLAETIASYIPQHKVYAEPFIGGGAVFFKKDVSEVEVINDKDPEIAFAYRFMQRVTDEQIKQLKKYNWDPDEGLFKYLLNKEPKDGVERFRKHIYLQQWSMGGMKEKFSSGGKWNYKDYPKSITQYDKYKERLQNVKIFNQDYANIIERFDSENTFFYFDPPYKSHWPGQDFGFEEEVFKEHLKKLKGKFIFSYSVEGKKLFKEFNVKEVQTVKQVIGKPKTVRTELLISNFPLKTENRYIEKELEKQAPSWQRQKINSPTFAYMAVYGKEPDHWISGRTSYPEKPYKVPGTEITVMIDEHLKPEWFDRLNAIKEIEVRASCEGHSAERVAYIVFRLKPGNDSKSKEVSKVFQQVEGLYSLSDIGMEDRPRIVIAGKTWYGQKDWEQWWQQLPDKIISAVGKVLCVQSGEMNSVLEELIERHRGEIAFPEIWVQKKQADPYMVHPDEKERYEYVVHHHFRGRSCHGDLRIENVGKKFLVGWTLDDQIKGAIKEPVTTLEQAKIQDKRADAFKINWVTGEWAKKKKRGVEKLVNAEIISQKKAIEPHAWLTVEGVTEPGAVGATVRYPGVFHIVDKGWVEYLSQKPWFHEYYFHGKILNGRFFFRQLKIKFEKNDIEMLKELTDSQVFLDRWAEVLEPGSNERLFCEYELALCLAEQLGWEVWKEDHRWVELLMSGDILKLLKKAESLVIPTAEEAIRPGEPAWYFIKPLDQTPYILTRSAIEKEYMPPIGVSALPEETRRKVPLEFRYWLHENSKDARRVRDALIEALESRELKLPLVGVSLEKHLSLTNARFVLHYQYWKARRLVREGPSKFHYILRIDLGEPELWKFDEMRFSPIETDESVAYYSTEKDKTRMKLEGYVPPKTELNPEKATPSFMEIVDQGRCVLQVNQPALKKIAFRGAKLKDTFLFTKRNSEWEIKRVAPAPTVKELGEPEDVMNPSLVSVGI